MPHTAKLFWNGRSQAVRLPAEYRIDSTEVYISKDPKTNTITIKPKPPSWGDFFEIVEGLNVPDDFMDDRDTEQAIDKDLF